MLEPGTIPGASSSGEGRALLGVPVLPACLGAALNAGALGDAPTPVYSSPDVWPSLALSFLSHVVVWTLSTGKQQTGLVKMASAGV